MGRIRLGIVLRTALILGCFATFSGARLWWSFLPENMPRLWVDAHVYYEATAAWIAGANPWDAVFFGVPFAAPPPALLLNLPLLPFGEDVAVGFWIVANAVGALYVIRRLGLPWYWVLCFPIVEGFAAGSPDLALAGLALWRGAWLAALVKPYSAPAIAAAGKWRALFLAVAVATLSLAVLPWQAFLASGSSISGAFASFTTVPGSWGQPVLMVLTVVALASLRREEGLELLTPGLLAQQPHYLVFSLRTISRSTLLTVCATLPIRHLMAIGIVGYAVWRRVAWHSPTVARIVGARAGSATAP